MNQIQNIPLLGLTHSPSDNLCQDGELGTCLGLISEDDSLIPIPQPQIVESFTLPEGASIRLVNKVTHDNTIHSHYIILRSDGSWYWTERGGDGTANDISLGSFHVNTVTAVGNILCFVGDNTTKYAFWNIYKQTYILFSRENFNYDISLKIVDTTHYAGVLNADLGEEFWEIFSYSFFGSGNEGNYMMDSIGADKVIRAFSALDASLNSQLEAKGDTFLKYNTFAVVAIRLYDGSYYNISNIFRLDDTFRTIEEVNANADKKTLFSSDSRYIQYAYSIQITLSSLEEIYDLIQGVDVFLTKGEPFIDTNKAVTDFTFTDTKHRQGTFRFHYMTPSLAKQTIDSMVFYHSVFISKENLAKPVTLKRVLGTEESISLANLFRSDVGGKVATTYNNRLHIANINSGNITLKNTFLTDTTSIGYQYDGIIRVQTRDHEFWWKGDLLTIDSTFLSVPVLEVSNITIYRHLKSATQSVGYQKASLKPISSETMGYSYYVQEDQTHGISFDIPWQDATEVEYNDFLNKYESSKNISIIDSSVSVVKVSEAENPLVFQAKDSVQVGSSIIYAISVNTRPISEGQFGDAPLYAFTDEGVWVLTPSDEGTYIARQPASRDICSNPDAIVQIDDAVLFPTSRGILMQQGRVAQCITDVLDGYPFDFTKLRSLDHAKLVLQNADISPFDVQYVRFRQFLDNGTSKASIIYNYYDSRIIVFNPDYTYAYVYSLKSQRWGTMSSPFSDRVNIYPESYALDDAGHILNLYIQVPKDDVPYFVCTRPFTLSQLDVYKTIFSLILRGYVSTENGKCGLVLYGSSDLHHWYLIKSSIAKYIRGICGSPYKYFRLAIIGSLSPEESLSGLSVEFQPRWQNKLR